MRRLLRWLAGIATATVLAGLVAGGWLLYTESGLRWALASGVAAAGAQIDYSGLSGTLAGGFEIEAPRVETPALRISAGQLRLRLDLRALWHGELRLEMLRVVGARYTLLAGDAAEDEPPGTRPGPLELPVDVVLRNIELLANEIDYGGDRLLTFSLAAGEIALRDGRLSVDGLALRQGEVSASVSAALDTHAAWSGALEGEGAWTLPQVLHRGRLRLAGDLDALEMDMALEGGGAVRLEASLAHPLEVPGIAGQLSVQQLDLASYGIDAPLRTLDLDLTFDWRDNRVDISGPLAIDGRALDLALSGLEFDDQQVRWRALRIGSDEVGRLTLTGHWPLDPGAPAGTLAGGADGVWLDDWRNQLPEAPPRVTGTLALTGHNAGWQLEFDGTWSRGEPSGPLRLSAGGGSERIAVAPSRIGLANSLLDFHGEVVLGERTQLDFALAASAIDPALWAPQWPGSIDATLQVDATIGDEIEWAVAIDRLAGQLRAAPVNLAGSIDGIDGHPQRGRLDLGWGNADVAVAVPAPDALQVELQALDLALLGPWQGLVSGRVGTRLYADPADTTFALQAADLVVDGLQASSLRVDKQPGWELGLAAEAVHLGGASFDSLELVATGTATAHRLQLRAEEARGALAAAVAGSWQEPAWAGTLESLQLTPTRGAAWTLADVSAAAWDGERFTLAPACLAVAAARACVGVDHSPQATRLDVDVAAVPLAEIQAWAPASDYKVSGELAGGGALTVDAAGAMAGSMQFAIRDGVLDAGAETGETLAFDGELDFDGAAGQLDARIELGEHGGLVARAAGIGREDGELALTLAISDLSFVDGLSDEVQGMRGRLDGELRAPLSDPGRLRGQLLSSELQFELPAAGLKATGGRLGLDFADDGRLHLEGKLGIAPGTLRIEGQVGLDEAGDAEIRIVGDNVGLVDLPAVRLAGDTNFLVKFAPEGLVIDGGILLRQGKINLDRATPTVPASEDVVIEDAAPPPPPLPITADVSIAMMQAVDLIGFGIEAKLNGGVRVSQRPGKAPRGQGEILVGGIYNAYGQKLDIERGRLGFGNRRVDNPTLDILAVKRVDRQRVGVQVRGTAKRPIVRLYSESPMDQSEILSMLVLGHSSSTADGPAGAQLDEYADAMQTAGASLAAGSIGKKFGLAAGVENFGSAIGSALVVGKYISPRFFVGYGSSLLEATQLVILRYRWTENIEMELVSGEQQKGSVSWRTER